MFGNGFPPVPIPAKTGHRQTAFEDTPGSIEPHRIREISVMVVIDTSRVHDCPKFVRGLKESAKDFADRVHAVLLEMQAKVE